MTGISFVRKFRDLEDRAQKLGFQITSSKNFNREYDVVAIRPKDDDALPIYSRDAELFIGSIEELEQWVKGVEWARQYDDLLFGKKNVARRERVEQDWRNKNLISKLTNTQEVDKK